MSLSIKIPEDIKNFAQKCDIEKDSRRDIIIYILQNDISVINEKFDKYQKEYEEKFFAFEEVKKLLEKNFVIPNIPKNKKLKYWSLNYDSSIITIEVIEDE